MTSEQKAVITNGHFSRTARQRTQPIQYNRLSENDTIEEINVDSKAEYTA